MSRVSRRDRRSLLVECFRYHKWLTRFTHSPLGLTGTNPVEYREKLEYNQEAFYQRLGDRVPIILEQGGVDIRDVTWPENPVLVVGNESLGVPSWFAPEAMRVSIPQWSVMRSMNVAVAASIAMWELSKCI